MDLTAANTRVAWDRCIADFVAYDLGKTGTANRGSRSLWSGVLELVV